MSAPRSAEDLDCAAAQTLLEPHLDGELGPDETGRLAGHVAACAACRDELRLASEVRLGLRALPELDCPPEVLARVAAVAPRAAATAKSPSLPRRLAAAAVAGAAAAARALRAAFPLPSLTSARPWTAAGVGLALLLSILVVLRSLPDGGTAPRPSPEELALATRQARFALAYVDQVSRRAAATLREQVIGRHLVLPAARGLSRSLEKTLGAEPPDFMLRPARRAGGASRDRS